MSRIGKRPIAVPSGVTVEVADRNVRVKGSLGELAWRCPDEVEVAFDSQERQIRVIRAGDSRRQRAMHGLARALIANMVHGVQNGYQKKLEIYGTGYSCKLKGQTLLVNCGYMGRGIDRNGKPREAQFTIPVPEGVQVKVEVEAARGDHEPARLTIEGTDKQKVGQFAAEVRAIRPPEPYKGKGIRYADEQVKRKQGKAFASGG